MLLLLFLKSDRGHLQVVVAYEMLPLYNDLTWKRTPTMNAWEARCVREVIAKGGSSVPWAHTPRTEGVAFFLVVDVDGCAQLRVGEPALSSLN